MLLLGAVAEVGVLGQVVWLVAVVELAVTEPAQDWRLLLEHLIPLL